MKVHCSVEKLKNAVALADRMTGKNLTLPILNAILITAEHNSISIRATNLAVGIEFTIPAVVEVEGVVVVKGDIVTNVCSNLQDKSDITLELEHDNLKLISKKTTTVIKSLPPEDFPKLPIVEGEEFEIKSQILQESIRSVYFAAATTEIKPEISSIYLYSDQGLLTFVATDSFRLAEKKVKIKNIPDISKILIPYKNITDVLRVLETCVGEVKISYTRNQMSITGPHVYFTSRLIDGGFPPYHLIIPKEEETKVVVMKQELLQILKLSTIFADKFFQVVCTVSPSQKQLTISSKNSDVGSSISTIDSVIEGNDIEVVCNLKYLLDVLQSMTGDSVSISFTIATKPIVIRDVHDQQFLYLLMPTNR